MAKNPEVKVTFKAFNKDFNKAVNEMKKSTSTLRQELKLEQTQLRLNGTEQQKLQTTVNNLSKQYEVAKQRTKETAEQLEKVKQQFGENSNAARDMETELKRAQITEEELANRLEVTTKKLDEAKRAETERTSEIGKAKTALKELQSEEERLSQTSDNLTKKFEAEKAALGENASETKKAKLEYDHLQEAKKVTAEQTENLKKQLDNAKTAYGANSSEVKELEGKLYDAAKAEQEVINKSLELEKKVGNAFKITGSEIKEFGDKVQDAGKKATDVGKDLSLKVTAPIVAFGALAIKAGMEFEGSMSNVAAVSGYVGDELQELEDKASEMGRETNKSASEAADALSYMALAGWDNKQMLEGIEPVLKLSSAGNIDLAKTSDLVTDSMSAMGIEVDELEDYLDVMAKAAQSSNTDVDEMGEAFITAGGKLRDLGIDFKEGGIALGLMADAGVKGSEAGRGLSAILTRLTSPTGAAKKALDELKVSAFDASGEFIGIEETLKLVDSAMDGMTQEQKTMYRSMIAGQEHGKTFSSLINSLGGNYEVLTEDIDNANGALDEMYGIMTKNLKGEVDSLASKFEALQLKIFKAVEPALTKVVLAAQTLVTWFNNLSPTMTYVIIVISAVVAAIGPLLIIFGQMAVWIGAIINVFGSLVTTLGSAAGGAGMLGKAFTVIRTALTLLTGPVGIVIAIVTVLIGIFTTMYKTNEEFREKVNEVWSAITEKIGQAIEAVKGFIQDVFGGVIDWWKENQESMGEATANVWGWIQNFLQVVFDLLLALFQFVWPLIQFIIVDTWNAIKNVIQGAIDVILGIVKVFVSLFTGDWKGLWEGVKQILSGAVQLIWGLINLWFVGKILKLGKTFINLFKGVFSSGWKLITNIFSKSVGTVRNVVSTGFNFIRNIVSTIMNGIRAVISTVWNAIKTIVSTVINGMKNSVTTQFNAIKNIATTVFNAVKTAITKPITAARDTVKKIVDSIKGFFTGMKLSIPSIKLPKLPKPKITGKFSLTPPSVPKISWNAKGGIFTKPTIFNTANAGLQGVGEAGPEAILPLNEKVLGAIGRMISMTMPVSEQKVVVEGGDVYIDGQRAGNILWRPVKENMDRDKNIKKEFGG